MPKIRRTKRNPMWWEEEATVFHHPTRSTLTLHPKPNTEPNLDLDRWGKEVDHLARQITIMEKKLQDNRRQAFNNPDAGTRSYLNVEASKLRKSMDEANSKLLNLRPERGNVIDLGGQDLPHHKPRVHGSRGRSIFDQRPLVPKMSDYDDDRLNPPREAPAVYLSADPYDATETRVEGVRFWNPWVEPGANPGISHWAVPGLWREEDIARIQAGLPKDKRIDYEWSHMDFWLNPFNFMTPNAQVEKLVQTMTGIHPVMEVIPGIAHGPPQFWL